jgi:hypothetical protein
VRLDNRLPVEWEYASEERLAGRSAIQRELVAGVSPEDVLFAAIAERRPSSVLEVGGGTGEVAEQAA